MEMHNMGDANVRRVLSVLFERVLKPEAEGLKPVMPKSGDFRRAYLTIGKREKTGNLPYTLRITMRRTLSQRRIHYARRNG